MRAAFSFRSLLPLIAIASLGASACGGDDFDPASRIQGVRVLAVKKSAPYAKPGEKVELEILYWDGKSDPDDQRALEVTWFGGCKNPAGDLYYGCYPQLAELFAGPPSADQLQNVGTGNRFELTIPDDIISSRPAPLDGSPAYGLSYVFFTACSGRLGPPPAGGDANDVAMPLSCYGPKGELLGPDEFVPGYTSVYVYDELRNENPVVQDFLFQGASSDRQLSVPRCESSKCPKYELRAIIDPASAELDPTADPTPDGTPIREQLWVNYYATRGTIERPVRLVNDATKGWNDETQASWEVPREAGTVVLWAIVRDNRGGVDWKERRIVVE